MENILLGGAIWLHLLATVILIGYYILLALVFLPLIKHTLEGKALAETLDGALKRPLLLIRASVVIFIITGIYLLLIDDQYLGFGDFSNTWSVVMLVKHVVVVALLGTGIFADWRAAPPMLAALRKAHKSSESKAALQRFTRLIDVTALLGVIVLLLTALAEIAVQIPPA